MKMVNDNQHDNRNDNRHDVLCRKVSAFMKDWSMTREGSRVLVGVSGGADSVCLLLVLVKLQDMLGISLQAVTVNHGIRGLAAEKDVAYVEALCQSCDVPLEVCQVDVPAFAENRGLSEEEAARILRYECFDQVARDKHADYIAVAHHQDDQCETVLHHLMRGSSLRGLGGMKPVRDNLIRPLLCLSRQEIEDWLRAQDISWRTDQSNLEDTYTRNYIRLKLIPEMRLHGNSGAGGHIAQAAADIQEAQAYLEDQARKWLDGNSVDKNQEVSFPVDGYRKHPPVLRREICVQALRAMNEGQIPRNLSRWHLEEIDRLSQARHGYILELPGGFRACRLYESIYIMNASHVQKQGAGHVQKQEAGHAQKQEASHVQNKKVNHGLDQEDRRVLYLDDHLIIRVEDPSLLNGISFSLIECEEGTGEPEKIWDNPYTKCFDCAKMKDVLFLRTRRPGDYFTLENGGRKSLKSYLIDRKIPAHKRDRIPLLADGSHVWWIGDGRISADVKISEDTKRVLCLNFKD